MEDEYCLQDADKHMYIIVSNVTKYNKRFTRLPNVKETIVSHIAIKHSILG
jgi:hypothetical protein